MATRQKKDKKITKKLLHKYRLVILNEDTFEERLSFKLTRLNVFVLMAISSIFSSAAFPFVSIAFFILLLIVKLSSHLMFIQGYKS